MARRNSVNAENVIETDDDVPPADEPARPVLAPA